MCNCPKQPRGRPEIFPDQPTVTITLTLPAYLADKLERRGYSAKIAYVLDKFFAERDGRQNAETGV